ncbi:kinase-like protein, partial [Morchella conica CCBAS932]
VEFFGWYAGGGFLYIAMEFVENGDLSTLIQLNQSSPLLEDTCREITRQTLEGLRVLHERHICHRDLKPQNILVARLDPIHVKIADFGVSKCLENTEFRTRVGTSGYIAPELLGMWAHLGRGGLFGYAADLWSMGCIIYEIISCKKPF